MMSLVIQLGHYIYTTWIHSRMVCTQLCNSGYPDIFFAAPMRSSYKCSETNDQPGEWTLIGLRFTMGKDAQQFTEHINRFVETVSVLVQIWRDVLPQGKSIFSDIVEKRWFSRHRTRLLLQETVTKMDIPTSR